MNFYIKLAYQSLEKNRSLYLPFILAASGAVALNFIFQLLLTAPGVHHLYRASIALTLLSFGQVVIALFAIIFLFYTYHFLRKRKASEMGLYSVLGMRNVHLIMLSFVEQLLALMISLVIGLVSGYVFSKILILLLVKLAGGHNFNLGFDPMSCVYVLAFFTAAFMLLFISDIWTIVFAKPVKLMSAEEDRQRVPKNHWITFFVGLASLVLGYGLALTLTFPEKDPLKVLLAVLLVILATYLLFIAGTSTVLGLLSKRASYYQPKRFISIANMRFRMRQNAVGLASITLLLTMTLVTTVSTASLLRGQDAYLKRMFPRDVVANITENSDAPQPARQQIDWLADKHHVTIKDSYTVQTSMLLVGELNRHHDMLRNDGQTFGSNSWQPFKLLTFDQYRQVAGQNQVTDLKDNQVLIYSLRNHFNGKQITLNGQTYQVKEVLNKLPLLPTVYGSTSDAYLYIVVPNNQILSTLSNYYNGGNVIQNDSTYYFNLAGSSQNRQAFVNDAQKATSLVDRFNMKSTLQTLYGGFFFIGLIISSAFIMGTGLIIYYKQIAEGRADHKQFDTLQKLGMSSGEIKETVQTQIAWLFALPIIVAVLHLALALPLMSRLISALKLASGSVVYGTAAVTTLIIVVLYYLIFRKTAKRYYQEVTNY